MVMTLGKHPNPGCVRTKTSYKCFKAMKDDQRLSRKTGTHNKAGHCRF
jgi:hypothetical protein